MNIYQKISVILALCIYFPLAYQILKGSVVQNFATWFLWVLLDGIAAGSMFVQGGNFQLPFAYVFGGTSILLCILKTRSFKWTLFETTVSIMVFICIVGRMLSGPRLATILSTVAMAIASVPQIMDAWNKPHEVPFLVYVGYLVVNVLSAIGGKSWTIEERFYPMTCVFLCLIFVISSARKYSLAREATL